MRKTQTGACDGSKTLPSEQNELSSFGGAAKKCSSPNNHSIRVMILRFGVGKSESLDVILPWDASPLFTLKENLPSSFSLPIPFFHRMFFCYNTFFRLDKKLGEDFACELPIDLETLTFGFAFNGSVEGIKVAWPPGMKALRFGNSFNPRPDQIASNSAPISRGASGSNDGGSGGSLGSVGSRSGAAGVSRRPGSAKRLETLSPQEPGWSKFLPTELEELTFGAHFNQPVVSACKCFDWAERA